MRKDLLTLITVEPCPVKGGFKQGKKRLWENKKMLVASIFSFSHNL